MKQITSQALRVIALGQFADAIPPLAPRLATLNVAPLRIASVEQLPGRLDDHDILLTELVWLNTLSDSQRDALARKGASIAGWIALTDPTARFKDQVTWQRLGVRHFFPKPLDPERLAGLVVANVPHPEVFAEALRTDPDQRKRSAYMKRLATPGAAAVMAGLSRKAWGKLYRENLSQPTMLTEADLDLRRAAFGKAARCRGPLRYYRELLDLEKKKGRAPEPDVTVPTVILWGARDKYLKYGLGILSALHVKAESTVVTLPHAGHWMPWESPETFAKAVRDLWTHVVVSVIP